MRLHVATVAAVRASHRSSAEPLQRAVLWLVVAVLADHINLDVVLVQIGLGRDTMLRQIVGTQRLHVDDDALRAQFACLPFQRLCQLLATTGPVE